MESKQNVDVHKHGSVCHKQIRTVNTSACNKLLICMEKS